ncbi:MAG: ferrous iron transport protein B [Desulfovibrionaceae bacterium]|nr:ferrous iron transport protein B [Desulfovibrionaceae bacterium]
MRIAVAGNPNSGKTTLFNMLTGGHQRVGNYSGVTVEKKEGILRHEGRVIIFEDLPGTYSLQGVSAEEEIAGEELLTGSAQAVLYVADAGLLERSLLLAVQIRELGRPMILACNMIDELNAQGYDLDFDRLSEKLSACALPTVGVTGFGLDTVRSKLEAVAKDQKTGPLVLSYGPILDPALDELADILRTRYSSALTALGKCPERCLALLLLEGNGRAWAAVRECANGDVEDLKAVCEKARDAASLADTRIEDIVAIRRHDFCERVSNEVRIPRKETHSRMRLSDKIDAVLAHSVWGAIIMIAILYAMFNLVIIAGAYPQECLESLFGSLGTFIRESMPDGFLTSLLTDGIINGLGGVLSFVPLIIILFMLIAVLEDSGYMARMAYIADRLFRFFGLHGSSVMPYITAGGIAGGCAIPGVMATRTMASLPEKLATMLTLPYMPCGAKLPVVLLLAGTFFPENTANILFLVVLASWLIAFLMALLLRHTILKGESTPLVMEMPPYRWPSLRTVLIHGWERTWLYLRKAGVILLPISLLLWASMTFPSLPVEHILDFETRRSVLQNELSAHPDREEAIQRDLDTLQKEMDAAALRHSIAGRLGIWLEPWTAPCGFNWRTDVALLGGIAAKEAIVSTLGTAYSLGIAVAEDDAPLSQLLANDPEWNKAVALSLLVFVLLYSPCFVTLVVINQESGSWKWVAFGILFNTALAYGAASAIYQTRALWETLV